MRSIVAMLCAVTGLLLAGCGNGTVPQGSPTPAHIAGDAAAGAPRPGHPADAMLFNGHWYKVFAAGASWHEKKKRCAELGGYLACIETEAEQKFIGALADGRYLSLGASDEKTEGVWVWVNGAPFTYTCWLDGQPNNYGGEENYLATYDGGEWVDVDAEGDSYWMPTGFICEWEK